MIKSPFTIYYDIETYNHHLKKTKQFQKIVNKTYEKLLKPYLIGYILKCNYDERFSKKCQIFTGEECIEKMILNLIFTEKPYIYKIIKEYFNKAIETNPDLTKFDVIHVIYVIKKLEINQLKIIAILHQKCLDMPITDAILNSKKIM